MILSRFPNIGRELTTYGYYERAVTKSSFDVFNKEGTKTSLNET